MILKEKRVDKSKKEIKAIKKLKKSMKERKRYVLLRGGKSAELKKDIENLILDFAGVLGFSKICLRWIEINEDYNYGIVSINRESLELFKASLCLSSKNIEILGISGTLKGLKRYKVKI
jgi:RNase P/RNase MRP subunit POP5